MTPVLEIRDLVVEFVDRGRIVSTPVRGVSLEVPAGQILGMVGETGCGKTLTGLSVLGLLPPGARQHGQILLDGLDVRSLSKDGQRQLRGGAIAMVFQNPGTAFNPVFTIGDQLRRVAKTHRGGTRGQIRIRVLEQLALVGLPDPGRVEAAYPHELSGGMLQRAMIAMSLMSDPRLLILDEPTTALDVTVAQQILRLLLELQERLALTVLLITHDLGIVRDVCDSVAVMYAGRVVERGSVESVLSAPDHPYTHGLLSALPGGQAAGSRLTTIPGSVPVHVREVVGCSFADRCSQVMSRCREVDPLPIEVGLDHQSACLVGMAR